jgi:hypothetical protein
VAIVQVSRITQRKGLANDLPQPLASAELGWAIDERKLFIGNGTIAEGAPVVGNTEILTEFSDVLSFLTQYTYKGLNAGYQVQTGATPGDPITQSLQSRLDSYAVISSFGATGDGVTDVTDDINRALNQIYCLEDQPTRARRSLYFPAGEYIISDTLNIPPNATLYGDGADSTIINFRVLTWSDAPAWPAGILVVDNGNYYRSKIPVPPGIAISTLLYWDPITSPPEYMFRTADSQQNVGEQIQGNAIAPGNVRINGIKFKSNIAINGAFVERANDCRFDSVVIEGPLTTSDLTGTAADTAAVRWDSTPGVSSQTSKNVTWNNCKFSGFTYGTVSNQNIRAITFSNCEFNTLYRGIVLGSSSPEFGGPTGVRIVQNSFDVINQEGVIIEGVGLNATAYNTFYDVGNQFNVAPSSAIIVIDADNNISVGDSFERNNTQSANNPRIALSNSSSIALGMNVKDVAYFQNNVQTNTIANSINLGTYKQLSGIQDTLTDNSNGTLVIVTNGVNRINAFKIDYTILRPNNLYRTGVLTVVSGTGFSYSDDFVENAPTGITLTATDNAGTVTVSYSATSTGQNAIINYSISTLG